MVCSRPILDAPAPAPALPGVFRDAPSRKKGRKETNFCWGSPHAARSISIAWICIWMQRENLLLLEIGVLVIIIHC
ncbi:hypothetical protein BRADI_4g10035v3 [Brachypodium distachyon]|uniref:Uncharacterized protein n=1 Tax=Brachypodium distachyon TaxID=15368 RepID=A0A0Q3ELN8_BRADI|nr:hypothetical protein BRADI_4g10035v3 [Brachypodium distachyon]